jgi:nucleoside-diphosphate-sugar epimerase
MLHTSGCTNLADMPMTGTARPDAEYDDANAEAVYEFEKFLEASEGQYPQRTSELLALDTGVETGVRVMSIQSPCIFGAGEGLFQNAGLIIPIMIAYVLSRGYGFVLPPGTGVIDYVHVVDLADWYVFCVQRILADGGKDLPSGKGGIVFPTAGRITMHDIAKDCLETAFEKGALPLGEDGAQQPEVRTVDLAEAATTVAGNLHVAEAGWAAHRKTKGTVARRLGWNPVHSRDSWKKDVEDELEFALQGKRGVTIDNAMAA